MRAPIILDETIIATAEIAEHQSSITGKDENDPKSWLMKGASWRDRRVFDWAYVRASCRRDGFKDLEKMANEGLQRALAN